MAEELNPYGAIVDHFVLLFNCSGIGTNNFSGPLPSELGNLSKLQEL